MHNFTVIRKIFVVLTTSLLIFISGNNLLHASVNGYHFTQSYTTYTPAYGGNIIRCSYGPNTFGPLQIGFNFMYNGIQTQSFGGSVYGWLQIGSLVCPPNIILNLICNSGLPNVVCPFNGYLFGYTDTLRYATTGTAPNRVCTIEWCRYGFYITGYEELSFEVKLYETSNVIQFIYHPINPTMTMENIQVGMKGNVNSDFITRTTISDWTASSPGTSCSNMYYIPPDVLPYEGLTYTFTPPGACTNETFPYGYGFGTSGLLDVCWSFEQVTGYQNWVITTASSYPNMYPYQGPLMATFPSHRLTGAQARIKSPPMNFASYNFPELTFFMSQDSAYPQFRDSIIVEASTDNGSSWNFLKSFQRYSRGAPPHWEQKNVDLSQFNGYNNVEVGIRGVANNGNNILIDTIQITHFISLPAVSTNSAVTTGPATARCTGTVVTNDPFSAEGVCWNTTGSPTISDPHTNDGNNSSFTSFVQGLNPNQTYHVRAYATNPVGTAYGNEMTFTTCSAITLPYNEGFTGISGNGSWPCGWSTENPNFVTTSTGSGCSTQNYAEFYYSNSSKWVFTPGLNLIRGTQYYLSVRYKTDGYSGWLTFQAKYGTKPNSTSMQSVNGMSVNNPNNTSCVQLNGSFTPVSNGTYFIGFNCIDDGTPWYFIIDDISLTDVIGIKKINEQIPMTFCLYQNYPNPFNPSTSIKLDIPALPPTAGRMYTRLTVYDILGREITTLIDENLSPGTYDINWNASDYSSGIYFYKINTGDFSAVKKMVLLK